ncbi:ADP-ribosylglycohydrolase family protein [Clostridium estertheticum]|uniref:ADP-ribosylglycohydrolase family protein n=1 Tax=Clostridium estertheticum TaxID=238834 RepID=UPI001C0D8E43|nr:ADP-ribosylglycohydrolase family protein [Clostridium estertheticum]MBU3175237.1 ADP-ribosylglycohydrolase family protein [Clostridium estertheticum]
MTKKRCPSCGSMDTVKILYGMPVEFENREKLRQNSVIDMRSFGAYNQKGGTWSIYTSMTLCLMDSLSKGLNYNDIMNDFIKWSNAVDYTPYGGVFDIRNATRKTLTRYADGTSPLACGGLAASAITSVIDKRDYVENLATQLNIALSRMCF